MITSNKLSLYIPELSFTFYGPIVFLSILIGVIVACMLMKLAGAKRTTIIYTALLTLISIFVFSAIISIMLSGDIRKVGFVGAGGALGLLFGAITSIFIHRDHVEESLAAWIIVSPLMYGLSKMGCHIAGCCNGIPYHGPLNITYASKGEMSYFPIQITETITFLLIFIIVLTLYIRSDRKSNVAIITLILSAAAKIGLEFLRESHMNRIISGYQILVFAIALSGVIIISIISSRDPAPDSASH